MDALCGVSTGLKLFYHGMSTLLKLQAAARKNGVCGRCPCCNEQHDDKDATKHQEASGPSAAAVTTTSPTPTPTMGALPAQWPLAPRPPRGRGRLLVAPGPPGGRERGGLPSLPSSAVVRGPMSAAAQPAAA